MVYLIALVLGLGSCVSVAQLAVHRRSRFDGALALTVFAVVFIYGARTLDYHATQPDWWLAPLTIVVAGIAGYRLLREVERHPWLVPGGLTLWIVAWALAWEHVPFSHGELPDEAVGIMLGLVTALAIGAGASRSRIPSRLRGQGAKALRTGAR